MSPTAFWILMVVVAVLEAVRTASKNKPKPRFAEGPVRRMVKPQYDGPRAPPPPAPKPKRNA